MPKLHFLPRFDNAYRKFTKRDKKRVQSIDKALKLFASNPKHPSLNLEKLSSADIWTIRINRSSRLFFTWAKDDNIAIFFFVGPHDSYRIVKK